MGPATPVRYDVFVSHSTRTRARAGGVVEDLVSCLRRRKWAVFWDGTCLQSGDPLMETLEAAIQESRAGLIVLTREAVKSGWVEWEQSIMRPLQLQRRLAILGLRLDADCPRVPGARWDELIEAGDPVDSRRLCETVVAALRKCQSLVR